MGVIALQQAYQNRDTADKACAILSLVGMVNIPIIYKSLRQQLLHRLKFLLQQLIL